LTSHSLTVKNWIKILVWILYGKSNL